VLAEKDHVLKLTPDVATSMLYLGIDDKKVNIEKVVGFPSCTFLRACDILKLPVPMRDDPPSSNEVAEFCECTECSVQSHACRLHNLYPHDFLFLDASSLFDKSRLLEIAGSEVAELLESLPTGSVVAGGAMVYACCPTAKKYDGMDVDIFALNSQACSTVIDFLKQRGYTVWKMETGSVAVAFKKDCHTIQVIYSSAKTPEGIIANFDLDYVRCFWSPSDGCWATTAAIACWQSMVLTVPQTPIPRQRLQKAYKKGFDISAFIKFPKDSLEFQMQLNLPHCDHESDVDLVPFQHQPRLNYGQSCNFIDLSVDSMDIMDHVLVQEPKEGGFNWFQIKPSYRPIRTPVLYAIFCDQKDGELAKTVFSVDRPDRPGLSLYRSKFSQAIQAMNVACRENTDKSGPYILHTRKFASKANYDPNHDIVIRTERSFKRGDKARFYLTPRYVPDKNNNSCRQRITWFGELI
jgi:hypothetical protein